MKGLSQTEGTGQAGVSTALWHGAGQVSRCSGSDRTCVWIVLDLLVADAAVVDLIIRSCCFGTSKLVVDR